MTVEELVDELEPRPHSVFLPAWVLDAIVVLPGRRLAVVRGRLLGARQRLLLRVGRDLARPRALRDLDARERAGEAEPVSAPTPEEVMTVQAARALENGDVCLVGVGPPNAAANLARRLHAPDCVLVYESGAIGAKPVSLPLSIGDDDLAATADELVSVPEMFSYWIGGGRMDVGFLGAADRPARKPQHDGDRPYDHPKVRLPGAGGAPEIAAAVRKVIVMLRHFPARLRRAPRLRHLARAHGRRLHGDHRSRSPGTGRRGRAGADGAPLRRRGRAGARGDGLAAPRPRAARGHGAADRA